MANDFNGVDPQKVKELRKEIKKLKELLIKITQRVENFKNQNHSEIQAKEKELEKWREKLEILQLERNQIRKEIREKVLELEKSDLENTEKQAKINKLLTEHSQELEEIDKLLYSERTQYRKIRDRIFEIVLKPCQACEEKDKHIKTLEDRTNNLKILTLLLLLAGIFHFFLFLWVVFNKKKKNMVLLCPCFK